MDDEPHHALPPPAPAQPPRGARSLLLGSVIFAATLLVLIGLLGVVGRAPAPAAATPTAGAPTAGAVASVPASAVPASVEPTASNRPNAPASIPTPTGDPVLVGAGDIADCDSDGDEATAALLDKIEGTVFTAGDNVYPSATDTAFQDCYTPSWGRHLARTRPAAGNHDWQDGGIDAYRTYFGTTAVGGDDRTWYAYDLGTWRIIVLDSDCAAVGGCDPHSAQGRWLAAELAGPNAACMLAIWHHPRFSSGMHGDDASVAPFWEALHAAGADIVVNGHDHDYERFAPQDPSGREDRVAGIREFVVGTGGAPLRDFAEIRANSELRASIDHGVLAFTLHDGSYDWHFHAATADFSDAGTARCH